MKNPSHSPGPWTIEDNGEGNLAISSKLWTELATVYIPQSCRSTDPGALKAHANADLIAAAPDLLAVVEELLRWFDSKETEATFTVTAARAALAKATGEKP